jgi:hypothetical protein
VTGSVKDPDLLLQDRDAAKALEELMEEAERKLQEEAANSMRRSKLHPNLDFGAAKSGRDWNNTEVLEYFDQNTPSRRKIAFAMGSHARLGQGGLTWTLLT